MIVTYKSISIANTGLALALFIALLFFPSAIYFLFGLDSHSVGNFMARRAAMLFVGVAIVSFLSSKCTRLGTTRWDRDWFFVDDGWFGRDRIV